MQAALAVIGQLQRQVDEHEAQYGEELLAASERMKVRMLRQRAPNFVVEPYLLLRKIAP